MEKKSIDLKNITAPGETKASDGAGRINVIDFAKETVSVVRVMTEKTRITLPEYREIMKIKEPPLTNCRVVVEVKGVATAVVNAIRRTAVDELKHHALHIYAYRAESEDKRINEDPFMNEQVLSQRIKNIPLRPQIPNGIIKNARFRLLVENKSEVTKTVMSGDITVEGIPKSGSPAERILFNPTVELAFIQPGYCIYINEIRIRDGLGKDDGVFRAACLGTLRHLDIPEAPREETHQRGGKHVDSSGYLVSTTIADPRHHQVGFTVPAVGPDIEEAINVLTAACANIIDRLRAVLTALKEINISNNEENKMKGGEGIHFTLIEHKNGISEGVVWVSAETHTIGNLVKRMIYELKPAIGFVDYTCNQHENGIRLSVKDAADIPKLVRDGFQRGIDIMEKIRAGIASAPRENISKEKDTEERKGKK